ncbi:MAG: hypothetical protein FJ297_11680 [Planctomycetes bacterium]|nr:hypothetical protein [Planctomycetota bacterium]
MNETDIARHDESFDDEDLVGYLDGELDAETAHRIEQRLAHDADCRARLRDLQASWDLLDDLPRSEVARSFAQSTVSMVAVRGADGDARRSGAFRRSAVCLLAAVGAAAAALGGYFTVDAVYSSGDRELIRDLPVIERMDMYQAADDTAFLRTLIGENLFQEESDDGP